MTRNKKYKYNIFLVMIFLTFLAIFYVYDAGKAQDDIWSADYDTFVTA
jgi:hypothetical protein